MPTNPQRLPGEQILDRYCPNLTPEEREIGIERLQDLAKLLVHIAMRQVREEKESSNPRSTTVPEGSNLVQQNE